MNKILLIIILAAFSFSGNAQNYETGVGLRLGFSNGISVKHFLSERNSIEGIFSSRYKGVNLTGLYQFNYPLKEEGLSWYWGVGGHLGTWKINNTDNDNSFVIGVDGMIGIEYTFLNIPLNLSVDYKPGFNIIGSIGFWPDEFAVSVRYTIK